MFFYQILSSMLWAMQTWPYRKDEVQNATRKMWHDKTGFLFIRGDTCVQYVLFLFTLRFNKFPTLFRMITNFYFNIHCTCIWVKLCNYTPIYLTWDNYKFEIFFWHKRRWFILLYFFLWTGEVTMLKFREQSIQNGHEEPPKHKKDPQKTTV